MTYRADAEKDGEGTGLAVELPQAKASIF